MARLLSALLVLLASRAAWACPVCGAQNQDGQAAYLVMTGIMSALPLLFMGGVVLWLVRCVRSADHRTPAEPATAELPGARAP